MPFKGLSLVATLLALPVWAQSTDWSAINGIYVGALGKQEIVLEIGRVDRNPNNDDRPKQPIEGRYFYRKHGVGILVEGTPLPDGSIRIQEYHDRQPGGAEWQLTISNDRGTGFFCKYNSQDIFHRPGIGDCTGACPRYTGM